METPVDALGRFDNYLEVVANEHLHKLDLEFRSGKRSKPFHHLLAAWFHLRRVVYAIPTTEKRLEQDNLLTLSRQIALAKIEELSCDRSLEAEFRDLDAHAMVVDGQLHVADFEFGNRFIWSRRFRMNSLGRH